MDIDLVNAPLGVGSDGQPVYLRDIWPSPAEVAEVIESSIESKMFTSSYDSVYDGDERWQHLDVPTGDSYAWDPTSTYVRQPPYFEGMSHGAGAAGGCARRPGAGRPRRQRHHRPHLTGRQHPARRPSGAVADRRRSGPSRLQLLRRAAGQPRSHDPGHVRQHPPAQPAGPRHRGRRHPTSARRRADVDLRRGQALRGGRACRW